MSRTELARGPIETHPRLARQGRPICQECTRALTKLSHGPVGFVHVERALVVRVTPVDPDVHYARGVYRVYVACHGKRAVIEVEDLVSEHDVENLAAFQKRKAFDHG